MITTAFQKNAFQNNAFQIVHTLARPIGRIRHSYIGKVPVGALRVITIKPIKAKEF